MGTVNGPGGKSLGRPETRTDMHRPEGAPKRREAASQKAQLQSVHGHGTKKDVKRGMEFKDGRAEQEIWGEWNEHGSDRDLEERVQMVLDSDHDLWNYDLHSRVESGRVYITGVVDVEDEKERLEDLIRNVEGVRDVEIGVAVDAEASNIQEPLRFGRPELDEDYADLTADTDVKTVFHSQVRNDKEDTF